MYQYICHPRCSYYNVIWTLFLQNVGFMFPPLGPGWTFVTASINRMWQKWGCTTPKARSKSQYGLTCFFSLLGHLSLKSIHPVVRKLRPHGEATWKCFGWHLAKPQLTVNVNMWVNEGSDSSGPWPLNLPLEASDIMREELVSKCPIQREITSDDWFSKPLSLG